MTAAESFSSAQETRVSYVLSGLPITAVAEGPGREAPDDADWL